MMNPRLAGVFKRLAESFQKPDAESTEVSTGTARDHVDAIQAEIIEMALNSMMDGSDKVQEQTQLISNCRVAADLFALINELGIESEIKLAQRLLSDALKEARKSFTKSTLQ